MSLKIIDFFYDNVFNFVYYNKRMKRVKLAMVLTEDKNLPNEQVLKKISLDTIYEHFIKLNIVNLYSTESKMHKPPIKTNVFTNKVRNRNEIKLSNIQFYIDRANILFKSGSYSEVITLYNEISNTYLKNYDENSSFFYREKALKLSDISKRRDQHIDEYQELVLSDFKKNEIYSRKIHQILKIQTIIKLSEQINDNFTVEEFKRFLNEMD